MTKRCDLATVPVGRFHPQSFASAGSGHFRESIRWPRIVNGRQKGENSGLSR